MDPQALWRDLLDALRDLRDKKGDALDVLEHLENLHRWLERGGFPPDVDIDMAKERS